MIPGVLFVHQVTLRRLHRLHRSEWPAWMAIDCRYAIGALAQSQDEERLAPQRDQGLLPGRDHCRGCGAPIKLLTEADRGLGQNKNKTVYGRPQVDPPAKQTDCSGET
jgi:hypothetical protein